MSARVKGRRREAARLLADLTAWARARPDVRAVVLVGSYARGRERMASDVDLVVLTTDLAARAGDVGWFRTLRPGSRVVRTATWGPVHEVRLRLRSGLLVELDLAPPSWADLPLDPGTRRVLADGHRSLHDPDGLLHRSRTALAEPVEGRSPATLREGGEQPRQHP